jgi:hypothetical protein
MEEAIVDGGIRAINIGPTIGVLLAEQTDWPGRANPREKAQKHRSFARRK